MAEQTYPAPPPNKGQLLDVDENVINPATEDTVNTILAFMRNLGEVPLSNRQVGALDDEVFTGSEWIDLDHWGGFVPFFYTMGAAPVSVKLQYSDDGISALTPTESAFYEVEVPFKEFSPGVYVGVQFNNQPFAHRYVRIVNDCTGVTTVAGETSIYLAKNGVSASIVGLEDPLTLLSGALLTRSVLAGSTLDGQLQRDGGFDNVVVTKERALRVAMPSTELFRRQTPDDPPLPSGGAITVDRIENLESHLYDSTWFDVAGFPGGSDIHVSVDQPGVEVYVLNATSDEGDNWSGAEAPFATSQVGPFGVNTIVISSRFFSLKYGRILVVNRSGTDLQEYSISYHGAQIAPAPINVSADQILPLGIPMALTQTLLRGEPVDLPGFHVPVKLDPNGFLQVSVGNIQEKIAANNTFILDPLAAGATETRPWDDTLGVAEISILAELEQGSALFGAVIEFTDAEDPNTNPPGADDIVRGTPTTLVAGTPSFSFEPVARWFRIKYTQGPTSGKVKVFATRKGAAGALSQIPIGAQKTLNQKGIVGAMLIEGEDIANPGLTKRVQITKTGFLNTAAADFLREVSLGRVLGHEAITLFARNPAIGSTFEDVWVVGGNYVYPTVASTLTVSSTSTLDDLVGTGAQKVRIRGLDGNYESVEEDIDMDGVTPVTSANSYLRVLSVEVEKVGALGQNDGTISALHAGSLTVGRIDPGALQTQLSHYTVPAGKTAMLVFEQPAAGKGDEVEVQFLRRAFGTGEPFRIVQTQVLTEGSLTNQVFITDPFPEKTDIKWRAKKVSSGTADVSVEYRLLLIDNGAL